MEMLLGGGTIVFTLAIIACSFLLPIGIMIGIFVYMRGQRQKAADLAANGRQGMARILNVEDTGTRINDNPRVRMTLEISVDGFSPYQVQKTITVPIFRISQVQVGNTIAVFVDPNDHTNPDRIAIALQ